MTKVASIQLWLDDNDSKQERIQEAEKLISENADADLILLPEVWTLGWRSFDRFEKEAETLEGETISRIAKKAKEVNAYIHAGSIIERKDNDLYNTAVLLNPKGEVVAAYRKLHLVTRKGSEEIAYLKAGKEVVSVETEIGKMGFGICYDLRFPELYRQMAVNHGVEVFLHVAAWPLVRVENWIELCHARANENLAYLISCNCAGNNLGARYLGHSSIVDQHGVSIASTGLFADVVRGEIDVEELRKFRKETPHLDNIQLDV